MSDPVSVALRAPTAVAVRRRVMAPLVESLVHEGALSGIGTARRAGSGRTRSW